jgi:sugar-specific transcriptional regulator TrmB
MAPKKNSLLEKLNIPEKISTTIGLVGLILLLAMLFPNKDFGILKTPNIGYNSWWIIPIGLLFIGSNIPFFKSDEIVESTNIIVYKESKELHEKFEDIICSAKKEIIFWGGNFYISVNENREQILERLKMGVVIKYLVFNPESSNCNYVSKDFNEQENTFYDQTVTTIKNLKSIKSEWESAKQTAKKGGGLEVRLYNNIPRLRAYLVDTQSENSYSYIVHFLHNIDSSKTPAYQIKNNYKGIIQSYLDSFNNLWDSDDTITLEEYLKETAPSVLKEKVT